MEEGKKSTEESNSESRAGKGDEKFTNSSTEEIIQGQTISTQSSNIDGTKESRRSKETNRKVVKTALQEYSWSEKYLERAEESEKEHDHMAQTDGHVEDIGKDEVPVKREDDTPEDGGAPPASECITEVTIGPVVIPTDLLCVTIAEFDRQEGQYPVLGEPINITEEITYIPFGTRFPETLRTSRWEATQSNTVRSYYDEQKLFVCPNIPGIRTLAELLEIIALISGVFVRCARTVVDSTDVYCSCDDVVCGMHRLSVRTLNLLRRYPNCTR